jgi:hypothetical protein
MGLNGIKWVCTARVHLFMPIAGLTTREKALILAVLIAPAAAGANIRCSVMAHGCCNPYNIPPCGNLAKRANNSRRAWWKEVFLFACRRMNVQNLSKKKVRISQTYGKNGTRYTCFQWCNYGNITPFQCFMPCHALSTLWCAQIAQGRHHGRFLVFTFLKRYI